MLGILSGAYLKEPASSVEVGLVSFTRVLGRLNKAILYGFVVFIILIKSNLVELVY